MQEYIFLQKRWVFAKQVLLYIIIRWYYIGFGVSCLKIPPTNEPNIYSVTEWQHWLGIAKPKNVFKLTLNVCIEFLKYLLNRFIHWLTDWLTDYLMPSDKHNSITAKVMGLVSSLFNVALSWDVPFCQLLQLQCLHYGSTKVNLCSPLSSISFSTTT